MNTNCLQIFIEYKIIDEKVAEYEQVIEQILKELPEYQAEKIEWFVATDQPNLYVEMFQVPTVAHYQALKKLRKCKEHPLFGKIDEYIDGGLNKLNCWAFQRQSVDG